MTPYIGTILKLKRTEMNINQEKLCEGICTPSYLSRIENNHVIADTEIYKLLFSELNIDYESLLEVNNEIDKQIEDWYKDLILFGCVEKDIGELKQQSTSAGLETLVKFEIVQARYHIMCGRNMDARKKLNSLRNTLDYGQNRNYFIYMNTLIYLNYVEKQYDNAVSIGKDLLKVKSHAESFKDYEIGFFYYNFALAYKELYKYDKCKILVERALGIFNNGYYLDRAIDCHNLLGICYNNLGLSKEAIDSYNMVKRLLQYLPEQDQDRYRGILYNNLGYCYELQEQYNKATYYYNLCLQYTNNEQLSKTIINLVRCHYNDKNITESKKWLQYGLNLINHKTPKKLLIQLQIFTIILNDNQSLEDITCIQKDSLTFFKENQLWDLILFYSKIFATIYENHQHYKKANQLYKIIIETNNQIYKGDIEK